MAEPITFTLHIDDQLSGPAQSAAQALVQALNKASDSLQEMSQETQSATKQDQAFTDSVTDAGKTLGQAQTQIKGLGGAFGSLSVQTTLTAGHLGQQLSKALADTATQAVVSGQSLDDLDQEVAALFGGVQTTSNALETGLVDALGQVPVAAQDASAGMQSLGDGFHDLASQSQTLEATLGSALTNAVGQLAPGFDTLGQVTDTAASAMQGLAPGLSQAESAIEETGKAVEKINLSIREFQGEASQAGDRSQDTAKAFGQLGDTSEATAHDIGSELSQSLGKAGGLIDKMAKDSRQGADAVDDLGKEAKDSAQDLDSGLADALQDAAKAMDKLADQTETTGERMEGLGEKIAKAADKLEDIKQRTENARAGLGAAVGIIGAAAAGFVALATSSAQTNTELLALSKRSGVSVETLSQLAFAAGQNGMEFDNFGEAIFTLTEAIGDAAIAGGEAAEVFTYLGIRLKDSDGNIRSTTDILPELADSLGRVQNETVALTLASQLFGEEEAKFADVLKGGSEGLKAYADEADRLGVTLSKETAEASRLLTLKMGQLGTSITAVTKNLTADYLPSLAQVADNLSRWIVGLRDTETHHNTLKPLIDAFVGSLNLLSENLHLVEAGWSAVNIAFNLFMVPAAKGLEWLNQGVKALVIAFQGLAFVMGDTKGVEAYAKVRAQIDEDIAGLKQLSQAALETADDWVVSYNKQLDANRKFKEDLQKTKDKTKEVGDEAQSAGEQGAQGLAKMGTAASQSSIQLTQIKDTFGLTTTTVQALSQEMTNLGTTSAGAVVQVGSGIGQVKAGTDEALNNAIKLNQAYVDFGVQSTQALQDAADQQLQSFQRVAAGGQSNAKQLQELFTTVADSYVEIFGELPKSVQQAVDQSIVQVYKINKAYETLGVESSQTLRETAQKHLQAFNEIRAGGEKDAERLKEAFIKVADAWELAYGELPQTIKDNVDQGILELVRLERAYETLGVESTKSLKKGAEEQLQAFNLVRASGEETTAKLIELFVGVKEAYSAAYGELPAEIQAIDNELKRMAINTTDAIKQSFENLGVEMPQKINKSVGEILHDFETVRMAGVDSPEVIRQAFFTAIDQIIAEGGRIPPNWDTIATQLKAKGILTAEDISKAFGKAGDDIGKALWKGANEGIQALSSLAQKMADSKAGLQSWEDAWRGQQVQFGSDLNSLQKQLNEALTYGYSLIQHAASFNLESYLALKKQNQELINELQDRIAAIKKGKPIEDDGGGGYESPFGPGYDPYLDRYGSGGGSGAGAGSGSRRGGSGAGGTTSTIPTTTPYTGNSIVLGTGSQYDQSLIQAAMTIPEGAAGTLRTTTSIPLTQNYSTGTYSQQQPQIAPSYTVNTGNIIVQEPVQDAKTVVRNIGTELEEAIRRGEIQVSF